MSSLDLDSIIDFLDNHKNTAMCNFSFDKRVRVIYAKSKTRDSTGKSSPKDIFKISPICPRDEVSYNFGASYYVISLDPNANPSVRYIAKELDSSFSDVVRPVFMYDD